MDYLLCDTYVCLPERRLGCKKCREALSSLICNFGRAGRGTNRDEIQILQEARKASPGLHLFYVPFKILGKKTREA